MLNGTRNINSQMTVKQRKILESPKSYPWQSSSKYSTEHGVQELLDIVPTEGWWRGWWYQYYFNVGKLTWKIKNSSKCQCLEDSWLIDWRPLGDNFLEYKQASQFWCRLCPLMDDDYFAILS
jgi:hypothetical protein